MVRLPPRLRPLFPYLKPVHVRVTEAVAPVSVLLSRRRGDWLPHRSVATLEQAAVSSGGRCVTARGPELLQRPALLGSPTGLALTDARDGDRLDRVAVAELPDGRVLGPHRAVLTGRGALVHEVSWYFDTSRPRQHPLFLNPFPPAPLEIPGRLAVLASRGDANYYHFLMDVLSRIGVLEQAPGLAPAERWYLPQRQRFQRELAALFGLPAEQILDADAHPHVRAQTLVVPGQPAMTEKNPPWAVRYLRGRLLPAAGLIAPGPPIYLTRGASTNNRAVRNEPDVTNLLRGRGFVCIDPGTLPVLEQVRAFAAAPLIVAPHGAALTNLLFASPGAAVVELFPAGALLPDFWRLACGVPGLRYRYLSAPGGPNHPTRQGTIVRDIDVDLAALERMLDSLA